MPNSFAEVRAFLAKETLSSFTDEHHMLLHTLQHTATVGEAVKVLYERKLLSLPVLDARREYMGCISVGDVLRGLMHEIDAAMGKDWINNVGTMDAASKSDVLKGVATKLYAQTVDKLLHAGDLWTKGDDSTTMLNVIIEGFKVKENKAHHRIFVVDADMVKPLTPKDPSTGLTPTNVVASKLTPTHVVSQFAVIKHLSEPNHAHVLKAVAGRTLDDVRAFMGSVFTVPASMSALEAFHHMYADHKSCVGIMDGERLVGSLGLSDIRSLSADTLPLLLLPVGEFVPVMNGKGISTEDALAGKRIPGAAEGKWTQVMSEVPFISLYPNNTFNQLLKTIVRNRLNRIFVVDDDERPVSIITLTDILRILVSTPADDKSVPTPTVINYDEIEDDEDEGDE